MPLTLHLSRFDGPLDMLLFLIGKAKINIQDIFVSQVTDQYIQSVRNAPDLDMDDASAFIAMAATLLAGCGGGSGSSAAASTAGGDSASAEASGVPSYASLKVGEDYTDLKADLKLISHRTDLIADGTFDNYVAEFQKLNPTSASPTKASPTMPRT